MSLLIPPPTKFVGFHGHTGFSVFDGLGYPSDHIDFVLENGMDAWALTDHGNGSGLAHATNTPQSFKSKVSSFGRFMAANFTLSRRLKTGRVIMNKPRSIALQPSKKH